MTCSCQPSPSRFGTPIFLYKVSTSMVNFDMIVDHPRPVLARIPHLPRLQRSDTRYSLRTPSCPGRFSRRVTQSISFPLISLRTLFINLPAQITRILFPIKRLRTLAKTTEGVARHFPFSLFHSPFSPLTPLESALTQSAPVTPLESALTIYTGGRVPPSPITERHPARKRP